MYTESGELFFSAGECNSITALTLSSSTILTSLKSTIFPLAPLVIVPVVAYIAFRKAWSFFCGGVRGA